VTGKTGPGPGHARNRVRAAFAATTLPLVDVLVATRVSANAVTGCSLLVGAASGLALVYGNFGWATLGLLIACLGDALDGPVARRTGTASTAGALFDASADRYQEFFALVGLAIFFRASEPVLALVLFALVGSFMVSYGSAKAEAAGVPVPPSVMRRPERAAVLWVGVALTAVTHLGRFRFGFRAWVEYFPVVIAVGLIAAAANVSAIRRLRAVARAAYRIGRLRPLAAETMLGGTVRGRAAHELRVSAPEMR
jgi:phosphatidylglycerophosphate synthase